MGGAGLLFRSSVLTRGEWELGTKESSRHRRLSVIRSPEVTGVSLAFITRGTPARLGSPPRSRCHAFCGTTFGCREIWGWCSGEQGRACAQDPQQPSSQTRWEIKGQIRADFPMHGSRDFDNGLLSNMRTKVNTLCSPCEDGLMCFSGKMLCVAGAT